MGVNSFSVMSLAKARLMDPQKTSYRDSIGILEDTFHRARKDFVKIGFYLKHIRDNQLYVEDGYKNINEFAFDIFHLSQSTTSRYINVCEQFSIGGNSPELDEKYGEYNISQLFEMITMTEDKIEQVTPDMSIREMRSLKISDQSVEENNDKEDGIPGQTSIEEDFPEYMPEQGNATSHKQGTLNLSGSEVNIQLEDSTEEDDIIDGDYREISVERQFSDCREREIPTDRTIPVIEEKGEESFDFPVLKNADERKEWLKDFKAWGLWYRDENIDINYYKFDFPDGSRLICCEYPKRDHEWWDCEMDEVHYHLLEKNKAKYGSKKTFDEKFGNHTTSETYLVEFLKRFK